MKVGKAIRQEIAKRLRIHPAVKKAMEEAFTAVLYEFREVTLKDSVVLESVGRQLHGVTGGQMREFANRLRDAVPSPLTEQEILAWADAHHQRSGEWPQSDSGFVVDAPGEKWINLNAVLRLGLRGLPGGSSLAQLLAECRGVRNLSAPRPLTQEQILAWADAHHERTGRWPGQKSGPIPEAPGETWAAVELALSRGRRGLLCRSSLAKLLAEHRGWRNVKNLPSLTIEQILAWADAHYKRTGTWPRSELVPVAEAPGETWRNLDAALRSGCRDLPGGLSLARLLANQRGVRSRKNLPPLTVEQITAWVKAFHELTGKWPRTNSGPIDDAPGETWKAVDMALLQGGRKLPGGSSLPKFLEQHFGVRNPKNLPDLTEEWICERVQVHHERTGEWPTEISGCLVDAPEETWKGIQVALYQGRRGLHGGSTLPRLLEKHFGVPIRGHLLPAKKKTRLEEQDDTVHSG
jgi:hypothetical protein